LQDIGGKIIVAQGTGEGLVVAHLIFRLFFTVAGREVFSLNAKYFVV